jgi:ribosome-associated protein
VNHDESAARRVEEYRDELELTRHMAETAARAAAGMFARDVVIVDLREAVSYTDYFVIASGETERQTRRIVEEILDRMREEGYRPRSRRVDEGTAWSSLDFIDVVIHVFTDEARDYYRLESLWRGVPQERWEESPAR